MRLVLVFYFAAVAWAQSALDRPSLGMMLDPGGRIRPVFGISGSVTVGDPQGSGVLSVACSREFCLTKTRDAIIFNGQETGAPVGPALFAFRGNSAWIYFPQVRQLAQWQNGQITPAALAVTGEVLSLRVPSGEAIEFAVRRDHGTWIVNAQDQAVDSIPTDNGPVMLLTGGVLYATPGAAILRRDGGSEIRFPVEAVESFSALGAGYVQVRTGRISYAIHTARGRERMFQLPESPP